MLDDFLFCINAVLPLFIFIGAGFLLRCKERLDGSTLKKLNWIVFNCALPAMLFRDISKSQFNRLFDPLLVCYSVAVTVISFAMIWCFAEIFMKDKASIGTFVQGSFRSNYAILGLILVSAVMGGEAKGKGALVTTSVIPLYNILSILVLSARSNSSLNGISLIKSSAVSICRNPLILSIVLALPFSYFQWKVHTLLDTPVNYFAVMATPLALLVLGGSLDFAEVRARIKWAVISAIIKLIVLPLVFVSIAAVFLDMRGEELMVVAVMCGSPAAVSSYIMSSQMGGDEYLAANIVLVSTLLSAVTFTFGLYFLRTMGYV